MMLKNEPENYLAWFYLGLAFHQQEKYPKAVRAYKKSLSLKPDYAPAYNNLADAYLNLHQLASAEKNIKKALELESNPAYFLTYAQILFQSHRAEKACQALEKARTLAQANLPEAEKLWQENCQ